MANNDTIDTVDTVDTVKIISKEGQGVDIDINIAKMSATFKNLLEDVSTDPIPLTEIDTKTLNTVVKYMEHHTKHPEDHTNHKDVMEDISEWDIAFCDTMDNALLFNVILASNYLEIKPLLQLTCKTVAKKIKGKTPDEIKKILAFEIEEK